MEAVLIDAAGSSVVLCVISVSVQYIVNRRFKIGTLLSLFIFLKYRLFLSHGHGGNCVLAHDQDALVHDLRDSDIELQRATNFTTLE